MTFLIYFQLALTVLGAVFVVVFSGSAPGISYLAGGTVTLFNLAVLVFGWPRMLAQKQVARAVAVIVFKFAILGWILYLVVHSQTIQLGWFALGLATVIPSVLVTAFKLNEAES